MIIKLQKLYTLPRNLRAGNKSPTPFLKKPLCTGHLSPTHKIFIESPIIPLKTAKSQQISISLITYIIIKIGEFSIKTTG